MKKLLLKKITTKAIISKTLLFQEMYFLWYYLAIKIILIFGHGTPSQSSVVDVFAAGVNGAQTRL